MPYNDDDDEDGVGDGNDGGHYRQRPLHGHCLTRSGLVELLLKGRERETLH